MSDNEIMTILLLFHFGTFKNFRYSFCLTSVNVDDRDPGILKILTKYLFGKLFGDKGYIPASLFETLFEKKHNYSYYFSSGKNSYLC